MELSTFLSIFLGFHNFTSIHAPIEEDNKTAPTNNSEPGLDNLAANDLHLSDSKTIPNNDKIDNITAAAPTHINATAALAPVPRDCCCHKEEPHYCDKSCQAFVIFALLSILLVAYLQANPVERKRRRRRRRSLPSWQLRMLNERPEWKSEWDTQMNRFHAEVVERTT